MGCVPIRYPQDDPLPVERLRIVLWVADRPLSP